MDGMYFLGGWGVYQDWEVHVCAKHGICSFQGVLIRLEGFLLSCLLRCPHFRVS